MRRGTPVFGRDGAPLGRVTRLLGDPGRDIFDGVAFRAGLFAPEHAADLRCIARITERGVHVRLTAEEAEAAPALRSVRPQRWRRRLDDDDDEA